MAYETKELLCRGCGAPLSVGDQVCKFCHGPVNITSIQSVYDMPGPQVNQYANSYRKELAQEPGHTEANKSLAICYMKLKLYDKARPLFEKAIEDYFDDADLYLYTAICMLNRKDRFCSRKRRSIRR